MIGRLVPPRGPLPARCKRRCVWGGAFGGALAALCLLPRGAHASGFHIDEQDARATGRAGAVTANPAMPLPSTTTPPAWPSCAG